MNLPPSPSPALARFYLFISPPSRQHHHHHYGLCGVLVCFGNGALLGSGTGARPDSPASGLRPIFIETSPGWGGGCPRLASLPPGCGQAGHCRAPRGRGAGVGEGGKEGAGAGARGSWARPRFCRLPPAGRGLQLRGHRWKLPDCGSCPELPANPRSAGQRAGCCSC